MEPLKAALTLAGKGFHVFPIRAGDKRPSVDGWQDIATNDPEEIKKLFNGRPQNIGIYTGAYKDDQYLCVIDVDTKNGGKGLEALEQLEATYGDLPETFTVRTPSGGLHYYFTTDEPVSSSAGRIGDNLDVRGAGGYVLAPFSSIEGNPYDVIHKATPTKLPSDIKKLAGAPKVKDRSNDISAELMDGEASIMRAIDYLQTEAPIAQEGANGDATTYKVACHILDFGVSITTALELLLDHWNPKCEPPWDPEALETKVNNAHDYKSQPIGNLSPNGDFQPIDSYEKPDTPVEEHPEAPAKRRLSFTLTSDIEPKLTKNFLIEDVIDDGAASVLYGPPNAGKTFAVLDMAWHIANGKPWCGKRVVQGCVLYLALEGGYGIFNRISALKKHYDYGDTAPLAVVTADINLRTNKKDAIEIVQLSKELETQTKLPIKLIVVDTLARAMGGGDENSASDMGAVVANLDYIRFKTKAHVMPIHHTGKDKSRGARGSNALLGAIDTEMMVDGQSGIGAIKFTKQRDMETISPINFQLQRIDLGADQDGVAVQSCVIQKDISSAEEDFNSKKQEMAKQKRDYFWEAVIEDLKLGDGVMSSNELIDFAEQYNLDYHNDEFRRLSSGTHRDSVRKWVQRVKCPARDIPPKLELNDKYLKLKD